MQKKPSQKMYKLTFFGRRFKSPFFLWLTQILKAVAMGVVAACGTFLVRQAQPSHVECRAAAQQHTALCAVALCSSIFSTGIISVVSISVVSMSTSLAWEPGANKQAGEHDNIRRRRICIASVALAREFPAMSFLGIRNTFIISLAGLRFHHGGSPTSSKRTNSAAEHAGFVCFPSWDLEHDC
jgi:hypothetical protein